MTAAIEGRRGFFEEGDAVHVSPACKAAHALQIAAFLLNWRDIAEI